MHKYLNAIGFHNIASEREWYQILLESEKKFSGYDRIALDEHTDLCELRREYGNGIGISSCGFIDENDEEFRRECYFPYFSGSGVSSYADIAVEQKASSPTYIGVCEDVKLGCSIIFHIQNGMEYIKEATLGGLNKSSISITFSGLALSGKILLPVTKDAGAADKRAKDLRNRMMLMSAAKEGNPDAIESLTLDDIDTYAAVSKRIRGEDIYSIVDTHFMPAGLECDQYAILGEILNIDTIENFLTGKKLYVLTVETNELQFDVCVPVEKVIGEPAVGRRLKAQIWLQGHINF